MNILYNHDLTQFTGFKTPVNVKKYVLIEHENDFDVLSSVQLVNPLIIGGGTNYLFVNPEVDEAISYIGKSITLLKDSDKFSTVRVEAGKNWHEFVMEMLDNGLYGLENLVLIPGNVGAAPVQNIGAYGREVAEAIIAVHCFDLDSGKRITLTNEECKFQYRHSIFKNLKLKQCLITHVDFRLHKIESPMAKYPDVEEYLREHEIGSPNSKDIANAIIQIRNKKLPNPKIIGNAGSFFKNPIIPNSTYIKLKQKYFDLPSYQINEHEVKLPAGWLIDKAGWKGFRCNGAGVHDRQALVLINADNAFGHDVYELSTKIQNSVKELYGIDLEPEVNIIR
jgi:UDP-N-acetylmuramate dehydrogenase